MYELSGADEDSVVLVGPRPPRPFHGTVVLLCEHLQSCDTLEKLLQIIFSFTSLYAPIYIYIFL